MKSRTDESGRGEIRKHPGTHTHMHIKRDAEAAVSFLFLLFCVLCVLFFFSLPSILFTNSSHPCVQGRKRRAQSQGC